MKPQRKHRPKPEAPDVSLKVGDKVKIKTLGRFGEVIRIDENSRQIQVQLGKLQLSVEPHDLEVADASLNRPKVSASVVDLQYTKRATVSHTLHLRGLLAEDAIQKIDKYLDDAYLAGLSSVTLVHGKGTGALATATTEHLKGHPQVKHFRRGSVREGGDGVTIVTLTD